jgi:SNF2 family DNA or RNA helicase
MAILFEEPTMIKLSAGGYKNPVEVSEENRRLYLKFGFNKPLMDVIKARFEGRKFHGYEDPPRKEWSIPVDSAHNQFQLAYMQGQDVYKPYTVPVDVIRPNRETCFGHQVEGISFALTRRHCILAFEMGTGKTLISIETLETLKFFDVWYVAPKSALASARMDYRRWDSRIMPDFMTYEAMTKRVENWKPGEPAPRAVIFDEASRLKTPTSKRSQAAYHLAEAIRKEHGRESLILLMSGSPAPKSPGDWFSLCRIACPGFLVEGSLQSFQERYALMQKKDYGTGAFNQLVAWKDNDKRCGACGQPREHELHTTKFDHIFEPMKNEVVELYKRMAGLVLVKMKKDCLDLPDKVYKIVRCDVAPDMKRAALLFKKGCKTVIEVLTRCRELSDGFQYINECVGTEDCPHCVEGFMEEKDKDDPSIFNKVPCHYCAGSKVLKKFESVTKEFPCGKDSALEEILEDHEDIGRIVIYAGFTASIDRVERVCEKHGWTVIRVDGRGCKSPFGDLEASVKAFQDRDPLSIAGQTRVAFIGHPGSAGMGLTLTAASTVVYFSNDFRAESRIQSEDRIHRAGMDVNRGATIIDLIGLETDMYVLDNLKRKRELQSITMGELTEASLNFESSDVEFR